MVEKAREFICDPLKCFTAFFIVNSLLFGLCASGYWNLDRKIDKVQDVLMTVLMRGNVKT